MPYCEAARRDARLGAQNQRHPGSPRHWQVRQRRSETPFQLLRLGSPPGSRGAALGHVRRLGQRATAYAQVSPGSAPRRRASTTNAGIGG